MIKIKNGKFALVTLLFVCFFVYLGCWQVSRALEKKLLLRSYAERTAHAIFTSRYLNNTRNNWQFYRARLKGQFDNKHILLLDNKTFHGKVGYEIYTLFHAVGIKTPILVDRGFIPASTNRQQIPNIHSIKGKVTITGMLNVPPAYFALGKMQENTKVTWPLRVEFVNLAALNKLFNNTLFPYVITLSPKDPAAYPIEWQITNVAPERHFAYAIQWFALALTLLILFVVLNRSTE